MKRFLCVLLVLSVLAAASMLSACGDSPSPAASTPSSDPDVLASWERAYTAGSFGIVSKEDPFVLLEIEGYGDIRLELFPSYAPIAVENFLTYVEEGFYDGVVFHRVIEGFMIQSGGFADRDGSVVYKTPTHPNVKGEFALNGVANPIGHVAGVLSAARQGARRDSAGNLIDTGYDTASSQFFICTANCDWLNGQYAAFGRVVDEESMAVVRAIEQVETGNSVLYYGDYPQVAADVPSTLPKIARATVIQRGTSAPAE